MNKPYYSLLTFDNGRWSIQFGDYSRAVVKQELADMADSDDALVAQIIVTKDDQASIDAAAAQLNRSL